jgi:5-methylcytosine-specific restriction endonuclease McrA
VSNAKPQGVAACNVLYADYRFNAKRNGRPFFLTREDFQRLTSEHCHYCGAAPASVKKQAGCNGVYIYNGLDRVDNTKGYSLDNVVTCCWECNRDKGNKTEGEFLALAFRRAEYARARGIKH